MKWYIRAFALGLDNGICWGILASKHQKHALSNLSITIVLQYHHKFMMAL